MKDEHLGTEKEEAEGRLTKDKTEKGDKVVMQKMLGIRIERIKKKQGRPVKKRVEVKIRMVIREKKKKKMAKRIKIRIKKKMKIKKKILKIKKKMNLESKTSLTLLAKTKKLLLSPNCPPPVRVLVSREIKKKIKTAKERVK